MKKHKILVLNKSFRSADKFKPKKENKIYIPISVKNFKKMKIFTATYPRLGKVNALILNNDQLLLYNVEKYKGTLAVLAMPNIVYGYHALPNVFQGSICFGNIKVNEIYSALMLLELYGKTKFE